ncbi:MAG: TetR/AcrR family transcriptional regulator [Ignavibacteriae bacterium]|nr:TetR/AcrR family transcriptional regulator [Ignavibacteriota bacterium]
MKDDKTEKEKILVVADKLFRENGLYKTSMDELAALLQISKKTIYKHFSSKDNLVLEITKFWMNGSTKRVDKIIHSKTDVVTKFVMLLEDYSNDLSKVSDKWIRDFQVHYPDIWQTVEKFREEKIFYYARKIFNQGLKEKYVMDIPIDIVITSHVASMHAIANPKFLMENKFSMSEALKYVFEMQLNGILTDKGRTKYYNQKKKHIKK